MNNIIEIRLSKGTKCFWCERENTNWCWNCEKPHCDSHARMIIINNVPMINTFCEECTKELLKLPHKEL